MVPQIKIRTIVIGIITASTIVILSCNPEPEPLEPPEPPEPPEINITTPVSGATVSDIITVSGTSSANVNVVQVKFGESEFRETLGTTSWTIDFDTRLYQDGQTAIVAKATSDAWDITQDTSYVNVENIDPLVGTWDWVSGYGHGYIIFHSSGVLDESNGIIWASFAYQWQRESESVITIQRQTSGPLTVTVTITNDDDLQLEWTVNGTLRTANYKRR